MKIITQDQLENLNNSVIEFTQNDPIAIKAGITDPFCVQIKPLMRTETSKLQLANLLEGSKDTLSEEYSRKKFALQVVAWEGLFANELGENIPADADFKVKVYEHSLFKEESDMIIAKIAEMESSKTEKEEDVKKNVELDSNQNPEPLESVEGA